MDQHRRAIAYAYILVRKHQRKERMARIRQESITRMSRFARKQALMFSLMITTAYFFSCGGVSSTRMTWARERSS